VTTLARGVRSLTIAASTLLATVAAMTAADATRAAAQSRPLAPFDSTARNIVDAMHADLQRLRAAEVDFYVTHHHFAMRTGEIQGFQTTHGTVITIVPEGAAGYRAVATNSGLDGTEFDLVEPLPPAIDTTSSPPHKPDSSISQH
jgi:hypothetical protein